MQSLLTTPQQPYRTTAAPSAVEAQSPSQVASCALAASVVVACVYLLTHVPQNQQLAAAAVQPVAVVGGARLVTTAHPMAAPVGQAHSAATVHQSGVVPGPREGRLWASRATQVPQQTLLLTGVSVMAGVAGYLLGRLWSPKAPACVQLDNVELPTSIAMVAETGIKTDEGGLEYVELKHEVGASAKVYLYGADVTSYIDPSGHEWIAVRPDAKMDGSKPISGGLSHCFPQFGPGAIQQHGFARNVKWDVLKVTETQVIMELTPSEYTIAMWDYPFRCEYKVTLRGRCLDTDLTVENTGGDPFKFQAALHSYFKCRDINTISITGDFKGKTFLNKMKDPPVEEVEDRDEITISEEYDRVYMGVDNPHLVDPDAGEELKLVNRHGWKDTVLWNPYGDSGMGYENFVCIESVAYDPIELAASDKWVGSLSLVPECDGWAWCPAD